MKLSIYICLASCLLWACRGEKTAYEETAYFYFTDFEKTDTLTGKVLELETYTIPLSIFCKDSILITPNARGDYAVSCYNLNTMKLVGEYIDWGRGANEVLNVKKFAVKDDYAFLYDRMRGRLLKYKLSGFMGADSMVPERVYQVKDSPENLLLIEDSVLVATNMGYTQDRLVFYNEKGDPTRYAGKYPVFRGKKLSDVERIESYVCDMNVLANGNLVLAYKRTDLLELYSPQGKLLKRLHGPEQFFPAIKEIKQGEASRVVSDPGKERDAYTFRSVVGDEFWCLYSGRVFDPDSKVPAYLNHKILVFDEDLKPLRSYYLNIPIHAFHVDTRKRLIYGLRENSLAPFVLYSY